MHSLEYIKKVNEAVSREREIKIKLIDETNDVDILKKWLKKEVIRVTDKPFCSRCGATIRPDDKDNFLARRKTV